MNAPGEPNKENALARFWKGLRGVPGTPSTSLKSPSPHPVSSGDTTLDQITQETAALGGRRLLLVRAEQPAQRNRLEELLKTQPHKWATLPTFKNGPPLLELVREQAAHGVVLDCRPDDLLTLQTVQDLGRELPELLRFAVCSNTARDAVRKLPGMPAVIVRDDASAPEFNDQLTEAFVMQRWLMRPALRNILPQIVSLPVLPATYEKIFRLLLDPNFSCEEVARLVAQDPPLTAQTLKVVNSACFAMAQPVQNTHDAVLLLGALRLRALVISAQGVSFIDEDVCRGYSPRQEWEHALNVASEAQLLARKLAFNGSAQESAFTAGVLHDFGKLLLAANLPAQYSEIIAESRGRSLPLWQVEMQSLGLTHAELGACLLGLWGLSLPLIEAVAWHHQPSLAPTRSPALLTVVHLADCQQRGVAPDRVYLEAIGLPEAGTSAD